MTATTCEMDTPVDRDDMGTAQRCRRLAAENDDLLYRLHARALFRYLLRLTLGDRRAAEDCLQEALLRTRRCLREHPADPEIVRRLLYTVARRAVIDRVRAELTCPAGAAATDLNPPLEPDRDLDPLVPVDALRGAMMSLSPEHRAALIEIFYHRRTAKEAAEILGVPEETVNSRAYCALRALRQSVPAPDTEGHGNHRHDALPASSRQPAVNDMPTSRRTPTDSRPGVPVVA